MFEPRTRHHLDLEGEKGKERGGAVVKLVQLCSNELMSLHYTTTTSDSLNFISPATVRATRTTNNVKLEVLMMMMVVVVSFALVSSVQNRRF